MLQQQERATIIVVVVAAATSCGNVFVVVVSLLLLLVVVLVVVGKTRLCTSDATTTCIAGRCSAVLSNIVAGVIVQLLLLGWNLLVVPSSNLIRGTPLNQTAEYGCYILYFLLLLPFALPLP